MARITVTGITLERSSEVVLIISAMFLPPNATGAGDQRHQRARLGRALPAPPSGDRRCDGVQACQNYLSSS